MKHSERQLAEALVESLSSESVDDAQKAAKELVSMLADRNEIHRLSGVIRSIEQAWAKKFGAATLTIATAYPLKGDVRAQLEKLAKGAEIKEVVDPSLIGGAKLRIDERIIDGSIKGHLDQLEQAFTKA
jgi:F-type H+-transporting ATPase subunit delta